MDKESGKSFGLIVNPIAGMGGPTGLKGTNGEKALGRAIELGATPTAPSRAVIALREIHQRFGKGITVLTPSLDMGEDEALSSGFTPQVVYSRAAVRSTAQDTMKAASLMAELGANLILFAGGDGTARDVCSAVGERVPVLGIPTGVKMQSAVFAINPKEAGRVAAMFLEGRAHVRPREVMDVDEDALAENLLSAGLYGYLSVPQFERLVQNLKVGASAAEGENIEEIAHYVARSMLPDVLYLIGPGTTTKHIMKVLGLEHSLLGVDVVRGQRVVALDANESTLLDLLEGQPARIVVGVIGGQGFVFGRGNQQLSPRVIRAVGRENITVVASLNKIASLEGRPLLVDTGDPGLDQELKGYTKVVTGSGRETVCLLA